MKWVTVGTSHWNTDLIQAFSWAGGRLFVCWHGEAESNPESCEDPDRAMYNRLCLCLGVAPVEVDPDGKG